jgi:O-antigen/teichoic acid export membrane protein
MLARNIAANLAVQVWATLMSMAFVPMYISFLGIDAYGLIGAFSALQVLLSMLDLGIAPALSREMARFTGGARDAHSIRDSLRTAEYFVSICAVATCALVWVSAPWLASNWLKAERLDVESTLYATRVMGVCIGLRFIENTYRCALIGLQRQVLGSGINAALATLRGAGAVAALSLISPNLETFFGWQALAAAIGVISQGVALRAILPSTTRSARMNMQSLSAMRGYAGGSVAIAVVALSLTNADKVLLSHLLELRDYGYYALAATAAASVTMFTAPFGTAYLSRLTQLHAAQDHRAMRLQFHQGAHLVSVVVGSAALSVAVFADDAVFAWTGDRDLASDVAPLLRLLVMGNLFVALTNLPYCTELAYGRTAPIFWGNTAALLIFVPAIVIAVPVYGAQACAIIWCGLSAGYLLIAAPFMFPTALRGEAARWYLIDLLAPIAVAGVAAVALRVLLPTHLLGRAGTALGLLGAEVACTLLASLTSPSTRALLQSSMFALARLCLRAAPNQRCW